MVVVRRCLSLLAFGTFMAIQPAMAEPPVLSLPLECIPQKTCFIQNYVDVDPTSGVGDYRCDKSSYDGHKGVDFRILSVAVMRRGVGVLAAAHGKVKAVRDGMQDRLYKKNQEADIKGRECGNGLVLSHGHGWETQYCHMLKGSLTVKKGDQVLRGQKLGLVGLSGKTAFPHVHMTVRYKRKTIDPFSGAAPGKSLCGATANHNSLWDKKILDQFPYVSGQVLHMGIAQEAVKKQDLMLKGGVSAPSSINSRALVFYGQAINLQKGDQLRISLIGPKGAIASTISDPMNRHKASYLLFAGKKRTTRTWPRGAYKGSFSLLRGGKQIWKETRELMLQ